MLKEEIIEFAKLLVKNVRDSAIKSCDAQLYAKNLNSPIAKRWHDLKNDGNSEKLAEMVISDSVDNTIFHFLQAFDNELFNFELN